MSDPLQEARRLRKRAELGRLVGLKALAQRVGGAERLREAAISLPHTWPDDPNDYDGGKG